MAERPCGWCRDSHVSHTICYCDEDCGSPVCPFAIREEMSVRAHP